MMNFRRHALWIPFVVLGLGCSSNDNTDSKAGDAAPDTATDGTTPGSDAADAPDSKPTPIPTSVDCSKPENCYHLACWDDPACADTPPPGGCAQGEVKDITSGACRACTAADCDGAASFCCGTAVCAGSVECNLYVCKDIEASCAGVTSDTCGYHDLDDDDAWGDCDEAPSDPCCWCKIAVGCPDSPCAYGNYIDHGACTPCSASTCDRLSCMGLNGCPTNCGPGSYFDGVKCHDCYTSSSEDIIPACKLPDGGVWTDPPPGDAGDAGTSD